MKLLQLRKKMNAKRPRFRHFDWQKRKEVGTRWRRPRGLHNKMRKGVWGKPAAVNVGYRGPAEVRGLSAAGLVPMLVYAVAEVQKLDAEKHGVIMGGVGGRLRVKLLEECKKKGITVLNHKDVDESMKAVAGALAARKEEKKARKERKAKGAQVQKKAVPKAAEPQKSQEEMKKEQDKVLTQRDA